MRETKTHKMDPGLGCVRAGDALIVDIGLEGVRLGIWRVAGNLVAEFHLSDGA